MKRRQERARYRSYLLRLWQTSDGRKSVWRASLQSPGSDERHGFANLEELTAFIETQTEESELDGGEDKTEIPQNRFLSDASYDKQ